MTKSGKRKRYDYAVDAMQRLQINNAL